MREYPIPITEKLDGMMRRNWDGIALHPVGFELSRTGRETWVYQKHPTHRQPRWVVKKVLWLEQVSIFGRLAQKKSV